MQKPFVVLQVLPELRAGGVERGTVEVARALVEAGHAALVVSAGGNMVSHLKALGVRHITLPVESKNILKIWWNAAALENIVREYQVDIIHARSRAPAWSAYVAAKRTGCHFVTTFHGTYGISNWFKRYYNSIMTRGERVIAISEHIRKHIETHYPKCDQENVRLIHRGVDLNAFSPDKVTEGRLRQLATQFNLPDGIPIIMLPGRITRWKGQGLLLDALKILKKRGLVFYCLLVGDYGKHDAYRLELEKKIRKNGLESDVLVTGHVGDMPAMYMLSDIVVSASIEPEAFGRVAIEGQAMGRMVIASDHGGSRETVQPNQTGWLVEPGNVGALANALESCLQLDSEEKSRITGNAMRQIRKHFSLTQMTGQTLKVYEEVVG